jgi:hypothetical protein
MFETNRISLKCMLLSALSAMLWVMPDDHRAYAAEVSSELAIMTANSRLSTAAILTPILKERGFVRSGDSWYRQDEESVMVVNLQSSWPGPLVNFGISWRKYGLIAHPKIAQCQVWNRLEMMGPGPLRVYALTDPSSDISDDDRRTELQQLVLAYGLPWLEGLSKFDTARSFLAEPKNRPAFIAREARAELEVPRPKS